MKPVTTTIQSDPNQYGTIHDRLQATFRRSLEDEVKERFPNAEIETGVETGNYGLSYDIGIRVNKATFTGRIDRREVISDPHAWIQETLDMIEEALTPKPKRPLSGTNRHLQKCGPQFIRPVIQPK